MAYDGTLKFDTKLDSSGFRNGLSKLGGLAVSGVKTAVAAVSAAGAALGAAGTAAVKFGTDYQQASNQLQASTGATKKEMEGLSEAMKNVYADNFGESLDDVAQSMGEVRKQMGNLDGEEIQNLTEDAIILRDTFEYDVSESVRAANTIVKNFGGDGQQAFNLIAQGAQNGLDYSGELLDSISEYSVQFAKVGLDATDMFNIFQAGMDNGAFNLDKIGDAVKEFSIRAVDGSKSTAEGFALIGLSADEMAAKFAAGGEEAEEAFYQVIAGLREMEDPVEQNLAGVDLFGTMWEDLGPQVVTQLDSVKNAYSTTADTMKELNEVRYDDLGSALETVKRHIETDLLHPVSEGVMPAVSDATDAALDAISRLADSYQTSGLTGMIEETGELFAELAVKAAEQAPKMVDAAVKFIQSFVQGISRNAPKLVSAAKSIASALVNGLVKLLPKEVQKPVKDTINILKKSFEDGGLKSAIKTVSDILKNLGTVTTNLAKTILPPLASAVDFVAENLDILLPILGGVAGAFAAQAIISQITSMMTAHEAIVKTLTIAEQANALQLMTVNGALTAKEVLVGLVTGKITLATAAQWLWNAAMEANPVGIVITAVAALTAGVAALCLTLDNGVSAEERLADANNELGEAFGGVGEAASAFYEGIQNAESHLSSFNDTLFASAEEQQELQTNMEEVQNGITTICRTATEERRGYTKAEIQQLEEYFQKLQELNQRQFDLEAERAEAIRQQAETIAETHQGSLEEYQATAEQWIATAQEQYDVQTKLAEEQSINEIALLNQKYGDQATMRNEAYAEEYEAIIARKEQNIANAQEEVAAVTGAFAEGYSERATNMQEFLGKIGGYQQQEADEKARHNERMSELKDEYLSVQDSENYSYIDRIKKLGSIRAEMEDEEEQHKANLAEIQENYNKDFDESVQDELGTWMTMLSQTELYGGKIYRKDKETVEDILSEFDKLPDGAKERTTDMMSGMLTEMEAKTPNIFAKAASIAGGVLNQLTKVFDIHSPSRKTRNIFRFVMQGGEQGLEDEKPKLLNQTTGIAESIVQRFQKAKFDAPSLVQRMKNAVASQAHRLTMPAASSAAFSAAKLAFASGGPELPTENRAYQLEVPLYLDGREVARATAEYTDAELEEISRRKGRGG